jgi:glycosyltransferase involved in cell wall biosynthesis
MNVGVYFAGFSSQAGGGYTFEQEMLNALVELSGQSNHRFVLFFNSPAEGIQIGDIKSIVLPPDVPLKKDFVSRLARRLGLVKTPERISLQQAAEKENIHFMWFPTFGYQPVDIPYIVTVWDLQHRLQPWYPEVSEKGLWDYREKYYSACLRRAVFIITGAQAGRQEISSFYNIPPERIRLLPHPVPRMERVPTDSEVADVLKKFNIGGPYLFYPAQFWAHKNHINLLLALRLLREKFDLPLNLVLAGSDQGNGEYVRRMAVEWGLRDAVIFPGFVSRDELLALYRGAFALTYVTAFGPENLPPLEAFTLDCPVVASNVPGAEEQLGDAALLVNGFDPEEIATAVNKLHSDPVLRAALIERGRARAARFTSMNFVRGIFALLDEFEPIRRTWE